MKTLRYRVVRPLCIAGRVAGVCEIVRLPEVVALEWIESGHLRDLDEGISPPDAATDPAPH